MTWLFQRVLPLVVISGVVCLQAGDDTWPRFRGPNGSGVQLHGGFPVHFGLGTNELWKVPLPPGHSSPCIWENRIFLTAFEDNQLTTLCIDRASGRILWRRSMEPVHIERGARNGSPAASTPAADGTGVYVYFGSFGLVSYNHEGEELWRKPLPVPVTQHGASTSPILSGNRILLNVDQDVESYLLSVDKRDGSTLWKTVRPNARRGFSTPLLWPEDSPREVVVAGTLKITAYDLESGEEAWFVSGLPNEMVASPVTDGKRIYVAGWTPGSGVPFFPKFDELLAEGDRDGDDQLTREEAPNGAARMHFMYFDADKDGQLTREEWDSLSEIWSQAEDALLAIEPEGRGDLTEPAVKWKQTRGLPYVPSPLFHRGNVYLVRNGGLVSCFDAETGEPHFQQERLGAIGDYYSSPVAAGNQVLMCSQSGRAVVIEAGGELKVLSVNDVGEAIMATPAILEETLYLRSAGHLYAFRQLP